MTTTEDFFTAVEPDAGDALRADLIAMIKDRDNATPRHLQRELGPSEIGHPCMRRMAYGLMGVEKTNPSFDPLPSIIGTATHKWLESAAAHANEVLGRTRWSAEVRVNITSWLSGSCDLYDHDTATVIDYKVPGTNRIAKYKKDGPGPVYRTQGHLYGVGFVNAGLPVRRVAIMFLPRGGTLAGSHLWSEDFDPAIAQEAIDRRNQAAVLLNDFGVENNPDRYEWFTRSGPDCMFCPWFSVNPSGPLQCGGVDA